VVGTEGGLFLSASDLTKTGYRYLHDGMWEDRQIVAKEWVKESLKRSRDLDRTSIDISGLPTKGSSRTCSLGTRRLSPVFSSLH